MMMVRGSAIGQSIAFHVLVVAVFFLGMPLLSRDIAPEQPILTVEIIQTLDDTNLKEGFEGKTEPKPQPSDEVKEPEAPPPPPPPPPAPAPPPPAPAPAPAPEAKIVAEDAVPLPSPKPKPKKAPQSAPPKPKAKPVDVQAPPQRPVTKSPDYKKKKEQQLQLASNLQNLIENKSQRQREEKEKEDKKKETKDKLKDILASQQNKKKEDEAKAETKDKVTQLVGQALNAPKTVSGPLGMSVIDQLRSHLAECWSPPPGAAGADALIVDIIVRLNSKAEVEYVGIVETARYKSNQTFKAAADAVMRAVFECSPLPLPLEKYEIWKELQFEFNPRFITRN
ncbi:hypothetical protein AB8880_02270 [Alphaproteobacteria bacterium LSUCC0684]